VPGNPQDRHQLGRVVDEAAVALLDASIIHDGDLGGVHVHADVPAHVNALPDSVDPEAQAVS
jgi:hypothetical protein